MNKGMDSESKSQFSLHSHSSSLILDVTLCILSTFFSCPFRRVIKHAIGCIECSPLNVNLPAQPPGMWHADLPEKSSLDARV